MNQAITWALVLTSGAGMSRVGPSTFSILSMNERAIFCSSARLELVGRAVDAALGAAERDAGDRGLPGHQRGERAHLVDVDLGVEADPALVGAAGAVVLDPVAGVDVDLAVGELDRDLDGDLAVGGPEDGRAGRRAARGGRRRCRSSGGRCRGWRPRRAARASARPSRLRLRLRLLDRLRRLVGVLRAPPTAVSVSAIASPPIIVAS